MNKKYTRYIALCGTGIAINFVGAVIATKLKLPLYLDAIGTVAVAAIGGLLPGITVGFLTNVLNSVTDSSNIFFAFVNIMLAVCTSLCASKGHFKKPEKLPLGALLLAVCGGHERWWYRRGPLQHACRYIDGKGNPKPLFCAALRGAVDQPAGQGSDRHGGCRSTQIDTTMCTQRL